jgi:hypothetical protein
VHKNTVHYRVQRAEELRGQPISEVRLDVELALLACELLDTAASPYTVDRARRAATGSGRLDSPAPASVPQPPYRNEIDLR